MATSAFGALYPAQLRRRRVRRRYFHHDPAVERAFGRAKHEWGLLPLRVRGIERVKLHADLTVLAQLGCALARVRAVPLAA
jgi:hypothetical protein